jgi:ADP-heptose:LPS heptosyltransferase
MDWPCYEDRYTRPGRWLARLGRGVRWHLKGLIGLPRVVLVETRWRLGDEVMALPVFESIWERYPRDRIHVLTNYPELYENFPFVDAVNAEASPDRYVLLRGVSRFVFRPQAYAAKAGVKAPVLRPHLFHQDWETPLLDELPAGNGPLIAVAPGASWASKRWERDRWQALCRRLQEGGARVFELGQGDDSIGTMPTFMNRTGVREAACLLKAADALVCCDSGLMHVGLATATPTVALFGPTDPGILVRNEPLFFPLRSTLACSGRWNDPAQALEPGECCGERNCCLDTITVEDVLKEVERIVTVKT